MDLLIGTSNPSKLREYNVILAEIPALRLLSLRDVGLDSLEIDEPFDTFAGNAIHKVKVYTQASGLPAFADDSGVVVDALDGRPGVYSARYGGPTDRDRYMKLLGELEGVEEAQRTARFICVAALAEPSGSLETAEGVVEGKIAFAPGENLNGFGYDAVFIPEGYDAVFSTLPPGEKNNISHRGRAAKGLIPALRRLAERT
jgi:XTP/dITP diphosphohydrolase